MQARLRTFIAWIRRVGDWGMATRVGRTWTRYSAANGPLLAQGLSYQSIFAAFAALWVAFAIGGLWLSADSPLQQSIIELIGNAVPGLIDTGDGNGAIHLDLLLSARILGWTGAIAALGLIWTSIGWFGAARTAVQAMFGRPERPKNPLVLKSVDAGFALGFGIALLVSAGISLFSTSLLGSLLDWLGLARTGIASIATRGAGLLVAFAFDTLVLVALYRVLAGTRPPLRTVWQGALLGALGLGILKALGGSLLGGASSNPLLASFAVIIGLLIWFNLVCQLLLIGAAWIAEAAHPGSREMNGASSVLRDEAM